MTPHFQIIQLNVYSTILNHVRQIWTTYYSIQLFLLHWNIYVSGYSFYVHCTNVVLSCFTCLVTTYFVDPFVKFELLIVTKKKFDTFSVHHSFIFSSVWFSFLQFLQISILIYFIHGVSIFIQLSFFQFRLSFLKNYFDNHISVKFIFYSLRYGKVNRNFDAPSQILNDQNLS